MKELYIHRPPIGAAAKDSPHARFQEDFVRVQKQKVRVYTTRVWSDNEAYVFSTTAKDVHLTLGTFEEEGLVALAEWLESSLTPKEFELLLFEEPRERQQGWHVTLAPKVGRNPPVTFNVAVAR